MYVKSRCHFMSKDRLGLLSLFINCGYCVVLLLPSWQCPFSIPQSTWRSGRVGLPVQQLDMSILLQLHYLHILKCSLQSKFSCSIIIRELHWLPVAQQIQYKIAMPLNKCLWSLAPQYLFGSPVDTWGRPPPANSTCNGQPQPLVAGNLLSPVLRYGTVYQLNCVCRHCPWPPSHDAWKCISLSALNSTSDFT